MAVAVAAVAAVVAVTAVVVAVVVAAAVAVVEMQIVVAVATVAMVVVRRMLGPGGALRGGSRHGSLDRPIRGCPIRAKWMLQNSLGATEIYDRLLAKYHTRVVGGYDKRAGTSFGGGVAAAEVAAAAAAAVALRGRS